MEDRDDRARRQIEALRTALDIPAEQIRLDAVVPVFLPDSLAGDAWPGPIHALKVPGLAVTWAVLMPEQTMRYATHAMVKLWSERVPDWQMQSLETLRALSSQLSTHSWKRQNGETFGLIMLHDDGVGPSRLLLNVDLEAVFPEGYLCAVPERSVGVAVSSTASAEEMGRVRGYVERCYRDGDRPFIQGFFPPEQLVARDAA